MSDQIEPVREKIIDILRRNGVKRESFFGSIVRGEMTEGSDVDLLVEFEGRRSLLDLVTGGLKLLNSGGIKLSTCQSLTSKLRDCVYAGPGEIPHAARFIEDVYNEKEAAFSPGL